MVFYPVIITIFSLPIIHSRSVKRCTLLECTENRMMHQREENPVKELLTDPLAKIHPKTRREVESWIVNSVKIKLIKKFEAILEVDGKSNLRKLLLVPVFTIPELSERIKTYAPELMTMYYKELFTVIDDANQRLS